MKTLTPFSNARPVWVLVAAAALLSACSEPKAPIPAVRPVYVSAVKPAVAANLRTFTATVRPRVETELAFRTGGKVVQRLVEVGSTVRAGQPLARLDTVDYALAAQAAGDQVRAARADAEQSALDEARFRSLAADGSVSSAEHERQKARADAASARLDQAQRQLALAKNREGYSTLAAPYAGVVTALRIELGQVVPEGQPIVALARAGEREIVADIPEEWVGRVSTSTASATGWAKGELVNTPLALRLRELSPVASAQGRTFRARFAPTAQSRDAMEKLRLGSTAQLQLESESPAGGDRGVLIPASALVKGSGPEGVWALSASGTGLVFTPVQVHATEEGRLRVTGLTPGQRVVSVGAQKLDAKLVVRAVDRPGHASASVAARTNP